MFQISILCIFLSPFCNYEIVHLKGSDHVCFDTWWLSLLLRMHEHAPWYFFLFFWPHPFPSCSQLPRTNQSSRFSCSVTAPGKAPFTFFGHVPVIFLCSLVDPSAELSCSSCHMYTTYSACPSFSKLLVPKAQRSWDDIHSILRCFLTFWVQISAPSLTTYACKEGL